jgi:hypothetical protein
MTVEAWTPTTEYTVSGIGPYAISHPYVQVAIVAFVVVDGERLELSSTEFSLTPIESEITGDLFLSPTAAATHDGRQLIIDRMTPDEQGWLGTQGERETGLMRQLDRMVQATQEVRAEADGAVRIRGKLDAFDWTEGTVPVRQGTRVVSGPTAAQIAEAEAFAAEALAAAVAAAASAAAAEAKENSMVRDRGAWAAAIFYSPSDIFTFDGASYITQTAHFGVDVADDLAANRIRVFAAKGAAGAGSGDMLKSENLSGLLNIPLARTNLGLGALATKAQAAFTDINPSAIITAVETLAANKAAENAVPTAKAVADYVDFVRSALTPTTSGSQHTLTGVPAWATRIEIRFDEVSLDSANSLLVQLGTAGGIVSSGYSSASSNRGAGAGPTTNGFVMVSGAADRRATGSMTIDLFDPDNNIWIADHTIGNTNSNTHVGGAGRVALPGPVTQLRLTRVSSGAFNNGSFRARYYR